jgi:hypothetical protein
MLPIAGIAGAGAGAPKLVDIGRSIIIALIAETPFS